MAILRVHHVTTYSYRRPVGFGQHRLMFRPRDSYDQRLLEIVADHPARAVRPVLDPRCLRQLRRLRRFR
ncbi:MAG: transglutaminase N-terminal domain-containing protein [Asticcacaulis sp.]